MLIPTLLMAAMALTLILVGYYQGEGQHLHGIQLAVKTTLQIFPLLICSFLVAGMVQVLLPQDLVATWVGEAAGLRGLLIGTAAGVLTPGGPYVSLPLAAGFLQAGAGMGTLVAFLTGWGLGSLSRMPMQVGILGWKFTLVYLASVLTLPPLAGLLASVLAARLP